MKRLLMAALVAIFMGGAVLVLPVVHHGSTAYAVPYHQCLEEGPFPGCREQ